MDRLLYFPYITIPKTPWLYKSLLYWDSINTITPSEYLCNPGLFEGAHMKDLLDYELVRTVNPAGFVHSIPRFNKDFMIYVDGKYNNDNKKYQLKTISLEDKAKIHLDKMNTIGNKLVDRGLAERDGMWYSMHNEIANDFMFYLATLLGEETKSQPITDTLQSFNSDISFGNQIQRNMINREQLRGRILDNAFPVPLHIENVKELHKFKSKHGDELKNFRKYIEKKLLDIDCAHPNYKDEQMQYLIDYIKEEKKSIYDKMKINWKEIITGSLFGFSNGILSVADGMHSGNGIGIATGINSIIDVVYEKVNDVRTTRKEALEKPLAYAFLVEQKLLNK